MNLRINQGFVRFQITREELCELQSGKKLSCELKFPNQKRLLSQIRKEASLKKGIELGFDGENLLLLASKTALDSLQNERGVDAYVSNEPRCEGGLCPPKCVLEIYFKWPLMRRERTKTD